MAIACVSYISFYQLYDNSYNVSYVKDRNYNHYHTIKKLTIVNIFSS